MGFRGLSWLLVDGSGSLRDEVRSDEVEVGQGGVRKGRSGLARRQASRLLPLVVPAPRTRTRDRVWKKGSKL